MIFSIPPTMIEILSAARTVPAAPITMAMTAALNRSFIGFGMLSLPVRLATLSGPSIADRSAVGSAAVMVIHEGLLLILAPASFQ